jgi:hypothetical protein
MRRFIFPIAIAFACGCVGEAQYGYSASATVSTPDLVTVSPGVQVIADYDEPIFYADGFYWRFYDNVWYRSSYYTGGWVFIDTPPVVITQIDRPYVYRHYRPAGYVVRNRPVPVHRLQQPPAVRSEQRVMRERRVEPARPMYVAPQNQRVTPVERRNPPPPARDKERERRDRDKREHEHG